MYKTFIFIATSTLFNFGFAANQALAQLTPQQCANDLNMILSARINGNITQPQFAEIANQHHYQHPECSQYISGSRITPEQLEMQRIRNQQHLEYMEQYRDRQVEKMKEFYEMME